MEQPDIEPVEVDIVAWLAHPEWMDRAACRGLDASMFYPGQGDTSTLRAAQAVCRRCPVAGDCLDYAMLNHETFGIWGGVAERQRRRLRKQLAA